MKAGRLEFLRSIGAIPYQESTDIERSEDAVSPRSEGGAADWLAPAGKNRRLRLLESIGAIAREDTSQAKSLALLMLQSFTENSYRSRNLFKAWEAATTQFEEAKGEPGKLCDLLMKDIKELNSLMNTLGKVRQDDSARKYQHLQEIRDEYDKIILKLITARPHLLEASGVDRDRE